MREKVLLNTEAIIFLAFFSTLFLLAQIRFIRRLIILKRRHDNLPGEMFWGELVVYPICCACEVCYALKESDDQRQLIKELLIPYCQKDCLISSDICPSFIGISFKKYSLPFKNKWQLEKMLFEGGGNPLFRFCYDVAEDKNDVLCILLHYVIIIFQYKLLSVEEAQKVLLIGSNYYHSLIDGLRIKPFINVEIRFKEAKQFSGKEQNRKELQKEQLRSSRSAARLNDLSTRKSDGNLAKADDLSKEVQKDNIKELIGNKQKTSLQWLSTVTMISIDELIDYLSKDSNYKIENNNVVNLKMQTEKEFKFKDRATITQEAKEKIPKRICPICNIQIESDWKFCVYCGCVLEWE